MRRGEERLRTGDSWLTGDAWEAHWQTFKRSAFRLETLPVYRVGPEEHEFEQFLATGRVEPAHDWHDELRAHAAAGRTVGRVHVITPPLSDYLRYEFACYEGNVEAGEDIRILDFSRTPNPGLPDHDFWMFDDEVIVLMHYAEDGTQLGRERLVDVDSLPYVRYKELAIQHSVPFLQYVAKD